MKKILIMPIGIPGCGKSTWVAEMYNKYGITHVSSDEVREQMYGDESIQGSFSDVFDQVYHLIQIALRSYGVCILDATNVSYFARREAIKRSEADEIWFVVMDNDLEKAKAQNKMRKRVCPNHVIERMWKKFYKEPPRVSEGKLYHKTVPIKIYHYKDQSLYWKMEQFKNV